jgi:hypothetical protein
VESFVQIVFLLVLKLIIIALNHFVGTNHELKQKNSLIKDTIRKIFCFNKHLRMMHTSFIPFLYFDFTF